MTLPEIILKKIALSHGGHERAIRREDLLQFARLYDRGLTDRALRNIYSKLPICTCDQGIFYPVRTQELEEYQRYLKSKAIPLFDRWKMVAQAHPHLLPARGEQMELFHG